MNAMACRVLGINKTQAGAVKKVIVSMWCVGESNKAQRERTCVEGKVKNYTGIMRLRLKGQGRWQVLQDAEKERQRSQGNGMTAREKAKVTLSSTWQKSVSCMPPACR